MEPKDTNMEPSRDETSNERIVLTASSRVNMENSDVVENTELVVDYAHEFTNYDTFATREDLLTWARNVGKRHGMVLIIKTSNPGLNRRRKPYVVLVCERSGEYRGPKIAGEEDEGKGKRRTGSKKCNCPFELKGTKLGWDDEDEGWELKVVCGTHNHPDFENFQGHSYAGRLTSEEMAAVEDMSNALVKPKVILTSLKQRDASNAAIIKTIYNARQKLNLKEKCGRSQMQELFAKLTEMKYFEYHRPLEGDSEVTDLLWTHPTCIKLACSYLYVLVMDCTYKTNRYKLPLLEIVGITCTNNTFSIAFAYLQHEKVNNYEWALRSLVKAMEGCPMPNCIVTDRDLALMKAVETVYPSSHHFLCRWHVSKNILKKCKSMFSSIQKWRCFEADWANLVEQGTEELFNSEWNIMKTRYADTPGALSYIADSWLHPYKERIISAWTNKCMHLGTYTSNRAEGAHSRMKKDLKHSLGTFVDVFKHIDNLLMLQHNAIKAEFEKSRNTYQHCYKSTIYNELRGCVSLYTLDQLKIQVDIAKSLNCDMPCTCDIRSTHGLPCAHDIVDHVRNKVPIPLDWIDPYWRRLSMEPITETKKPRLTYTDDVAAFVKLWESSDEMKRAQLLIKLRQIVRPETTSLTEPEEKAITKGRPGKKLKVDKSTRRDLSGFEYELSSKDSCSPKVLTRETCTTSCATQKPPLGPKPITFSMVSARYKSAKSAVRNKSGKDTFIAQIHPKFRKFVRDIKNVESDGHCGFRAVASMVGLGEDRWAQVRSDLIDELFKNNDIYMNMHKRRENLDEIESALRCTQTPAPLKNWMSMPNMGHLIASKYDIVLVYLAPQQCLTFLPVSSEPKPIEMRQEHGIAFVNENHFVHVILKNNCPIPPVAGYWTRYHHPSASGWKSDAMDTRIELFRKLVDAKVALQESVYEIS